MVAVSVCQNMKWTYQEFLEQPNWFIELLFIKLKLDEKEMEKYGKK